MPSTVFSRSFLQLLVQSMPFPVHVFSGGGKTLFQNAASEKLRKISGLEGHLAAIHPEDRELTFSHWEKCLSEKVVLEHQVRYLGADQKYRWCVEKIFLVEEFRAGVLLDSHSKKTTTVLKVLDFSREIEAVLSEHRQIYGNRYEFTRASGVVGWSDSAGVRRIFENLLTNAFKYGDRSSKIEIQLKPEKDNIVLRVHNKGTPIPAAFIPELFLHYQSANHEKGSAGWGLGLYVVKELTESLGGTVSVESSETHGTTFTVVLPRDSRSNS